MWKVNGIGTNLGSRCGTLNLNRMDKDGNETEEYMALPITTHETFDFSYTPEALSDGAVADLLHDILETLNTDEILFQPAYVNAPAKAKICGHINQ